MTGLEIALLIWSGAALTWWMIAIRLVARGPQTRAAPPEAPAKRVSLFKPLPVLPTADSVRRLADAVESFARELDADSEMLLGIPEEQAAAWQPVVDRWRRLCPEAVIKTVIRPPPRQWANPKMAWQQVLAAHAEGEWWLWADADVVATRGLLKTLRSELAESGAGAVTCGYRIAGVKQPGEALDALFVNAEFLPGALLLGRRGPLDFAFGAGVLFRAADFHERAGWARLGNELADDFHLGRALRPVRLSRALVETQAQCGGLAGALRHYQRWHKTVRWCRPGGYAGMLLIVPLLGWCCGALLQPQDPLFRAGLAGQWLLEALAGFGLLNGAKCRVPPACWPMILLWPWLRAATWLLSWLPLPVEWGEPGRRWWRPGAVAPP